MVSDTNDEVDRVILNVHDAQPSQYLQVDDGEPALYWKLVGFTEELDVVLRAQLTWDEADVIATAGPIDLSDLLLRNADRHSELLVRPQSGIIDLRVGITLDSSTSIDLLWALDTLVAAFQGLNLIDVTESGTQVDLPPEWFDDFRRDLDAYVAELHHANELEESA